MFCGTADQDVARVDQRRARTMFAGNVMSGSLGHLLASAAATT
jgi:hypothetical protein